MVTCCLSLDQKRRTPGCFSLTPPLSFLLTAPHCGLRFPQGQRGLMVMSFPSYLVRRRTCSTSRRATDVRSDREGQGFVQRSSKRWRLRSGLDLCGGRLPGASVLRRRRTMVTQRTQSMTGASTPRIALASRADSSMPCPLAEAHTACGSAAGRVTSCAPRDDRSLFYIANPQLSRRSRRTRRTQLEMRGVR